MGEKASNKIHFRIQTILVCISAATSMLVTDVDRSLCWWQTWDVDGRSFYRKSRQHNYFVTNILVANITVAVWTSLLCRIHHPATVILVTMLCWWLYGPLSVTNIDLAHHLESSLDKQYIYLVHFMIIQSIYNNTSWFYHVFNLTIW